MNTDPKNKPNRAIFLDRDGVINKVVYHENIKKPSSPWKIEEFQLLKGIKKPLEKIKKQGFLIFVISNQPDISRGNIIKGTTEKIDNILYEKLPITDIKVCPHDYYHNCSCRKPKPGMITDLAKKYKVNLKKSFLIGDSWKDIEAGKKAECTCILIDKPYNKKVEAEYRKKDLQSAINLIESLI